MSGWRDRPAEIVAQIRARIPVVRARIQRFVAAAKIRIRRTTPFGATVVATLVAVWLFGVLNPGPAALTNTDVQKTVDQVLASQTPAPIVAQQVYQAVAPSIVFIAVKDRTATGNTSDALGSGVVIDQQGDILTSLHVVADATSIAITFADGSQSSATVTTRQPENDIAVLQAANPPATIVPATLGNPNSVQVGDDAYVVGNPFGLYSSMSAGVVSGLGRTFEMPETKQVLHGLIQVDAAINPGNSGGALLNRGGQVIGIVTGLVNPTEQNVFIGIGLAVPIDVAGGAAGLPPD